jgi:hypothetical protein
MKARTVAAVAVTLSLAAVSSAMADWCRDVRHSRWEQPFVKRYPDPLSLTVGSIDDDDWVIDVDAVRNQFGFWIKVARPTYWRPRTLGWVHVWHLYPPYWCIIGRERY